MSPPARSCGRRQIINIYYGRAESRQQFRESETVAKEVYVIVETAGDAKQHHTEHADAKGGTRAAVAAEGGDGGLVGLNVHGLDDEQVVVERNDGVDQGYEHEEMIAGIERCHEHEELGEETCERGDTGQGEEAERHEERELRVGAVKAVVVVHAYLAAVLLYHVKHGEGAEVGGHVDEEVEHKGGHALRRATHNSQYEVAGLRDGGEGHETLEVFLADGEEVGHGDGGDDNPEEAFAPEAEEGIGTEHFHQDGHEHEGGGALGDDAQITGNDGRSSLIGVGRPEMEGHEGNLEAETGDEEHEAEHAQKVDRQAVGQLVKVEGAGGTIDKRHAVEQQGCREEGEQDVLGTGLGAFILFLVIGHEGGHGDGGQLESDEEHEEVAAGNHEIHAQQGKEHEGVELAHLDAVLAAVEPRTGHEEDDNDAHVEHTLDDGHHGGMLVHAAESLRRQGGIGAPRHEIDDGVRYHEQHGEKRAYIAAAAGRRAVGAASPGQSLFLFATEEQVCQEYDDNDGEEAEFLGHAQKLRIIHLHSCFAVLR